MISREFISATRQALYEVWSSLDATRQMGLRHVRFYIQYTPTRRQLIATGTRPNQILLGLYRIDGRPAITVFERSLRIVTQSRNLKEMIRGTLEHEILQHHFGTNHTIRT